MAKQTFAFVAVFAALLSVTLSVQAQETLTDYYWSGGASDNLYYTIGNWKLDDTHPASTPLNDNDSSTDNTIRLNLYGNQNLNISLNYTHLGSNVKKLIVGGGTYTTKLTRSSTGTLTVAANKSIEIVNNGTLQVDSTLFLNANAALSVKDNGTFALKGFETAGTFDYSSSKDFRIADGVDAIVKITGGEATINADTHVGIGRQTGTINQSGGNVTFYKNLNLGWVNTSDGSGHYILSGGTLTTKANAGLWNNYNNGAANTFTMTGGTANFQQTGESFAIGANNNTNIVKNVFNLYSGTVNATDTFAIKHSGTLKVAQNAVEDPETHEVTVTGGDGVLNAKGITLTTGGILDMSSGTINVGESGITSSDGSYSINLSGGTFGTNGASWSSALTANIASGSAVTFNPDSGKTITWSGVLKDAGGVTKTGAGTLTLSGANTYTGGTTISAGTLAISNANGLGTGAVTIDGGKLDSSAAVINVANSFVVGENGGAITAKTGDYSSFSSISGSGDLTTNGYVNFNGTGGYNGHITVKSGYTRINNSNVFGVFDLTIDGGHFNVLNSGTIKIGKLNGSESSYYLFGASENNEYVFEIGYGTESTDSATYGSAIRGSNTTNGNVTIKKVGEGTQTFNRGGWGYSSSDNKHSIKAVIVDEGKMIIDANNTTAFQGGKTEGYWGYAPITVNSGATLEYVRAWTTSPNVLMTVNGGTLTLDTVQYQNKMVLNSATINGAGNLQVGHKGDGEWTVKGGTSTINNNFVIVKTDNVNKTFTINFDAGATLDIKKGMSGMSGHTGTNVIFKGTGNEPGNIIIEAQSGDMSGLGNLTFDNMNGSIAAVYSGTGSLTKSGAGTVTLSGENTYTGATSVSGGELLFTGSTLPVSEMTVTGGTLALGTEDNAITAQGGTSIKATGTGAVRVDGDLAINSGVLTVQGDWTGDGAINVNGGATATGQLRVYTNFSYENGITLNGGILRNANSGGNNNSPATITAPINVTADSKLQAGWSSNVIITGELTGSGKLTVPEDSGWVIVGTSASADNPFTGGVQTNWKKSNDTVTQGQLRLAADQPFGASAGTASIFGTLDMNGYSQKFKGLHSNAESGTNKGNIYNEKQTLSTLTLDMTSQNGTSLSDTYYGVITGNIALVITGTGTQTLVQAPDYTGSTTIESGTLQLNAGGTLYNLSGEGTVSYGANNLTLKNSVDTTFSGSISGSGDLRLGNNENDAWIVMDTICDVTGKIRIFYDNASQGASQGRVRLGRNNAFGLNADQADVYGTLDMNGFSQTFKGLNSDADKGPIYNNAETLSTLTLNTTGKDLTFKSSIQGNIALVITGTGTQTLSKAPEYTGSTTIESGTLVLSAGGTLYNLSGSDAGVLNNNGAAITVDSSADTEFAGVIEGAGGLTKTGTKTLTLSGANTYTGATTVSGGVLELTGDAIVANGQVSLGTDGTLEYNWNGSGDKTLTIDAVAKKIYGTGKIIVNTDEEATLKIFASAKGMIDVQSLTISSGRVDIKDYFDGQLIVQGQGTFSPGNSVGSLEIGNGTYGSAGFVLNEPGATLLMEIGGSAPSANDGLIVAGLITLADDSVITLVNNSNLGRGESFTAILSAENSSTLDVLNHIQTTDFTELKYLQITDATYGNVYAITGRTFNANEVPEPSTWALLIIGAAGLLYWRKKKNA